MKAWFFGLLSRWFGYNFQSTPKETILAQTQEKRLLPVGREEFNAWSDRIISGTLLPADPQSMKFALADMLLRLSPTEHAKDDAYFIQSLRKFAVNQVAVAMQSEIKAERVAQTAAEEAAKALAAQQAADANQAAEDTLKRAESLKIAVQNKGQDVESKPSEDTQYPNGTIADGASSVSAKHA